MGKSHSLMKKQRAPSLIDGWLSPQARLLERHELRIAAPPEQASEVIQQVTLADMPIMRALFMMRGIPHSKEMTLRQFFSTPPFLILQEEPPNEVVIGSTGRSWRLTGDRKRPGLPSTPEKFRTYAEEGSMRVIANVRAEAMESGSLISTETWVETFGSRARWLFRAYWLIVGPFSALIRREFLRATRRRSKA